MLWHWTLSTSKYILFFLVAFIKGCVHYIFPSLFYISKREKTRKNAFYFTSKALFVLEIIKFQHFRYSNIMTSWNTQAWNTKHILLNNCSLVMKFGQFIQYYKIIFFIKEVYKNCALENSSRPFLIFKKSLVKKIVWRSACWFGQILIDSLLHII